MSGPFFKGGRRSRCARHTLPLLDEDPSCFPWPRRRARKDRLSGGRGRAAGGTSCTWEECKGDSLSVPGERFSVGNLRKSVKSVDEHPLSGKATGSHRSYALSFPSGQNPCSSCVNPCRRGIVLTEPHRANDYSPLRVFFLLTLLPGLAAVARAGFGTRCCPLRPRVSARAEVVGSSSGRGCDARFVGPVTSDVTSRATLRRPTVLRSPLPFAFVPLVFACLPLRPFSRFSFFWYSA